MPLSAAILRKRRKRTGRAETLLLLIALPAAMLVTACRPQNETSLVVTVINEKQDRVPSATVRIHCDTASNPGCVIDDVKTADESGVTTHVFRYPAVLIAEARKDSLYGTAPVDLKEGEVAAIKVTVK